MTIEAKVILKVLDYFIVMAELNGIMDQKNRAVREQDYLSGAKLRDLEVEKRKQLPTAEDFASIKEELLKSL